MALLLSLETSTHSFSCALHQDRKLIAFIKNLDEQSTASMLTVSIEKLFMESGLKKDQLNAVVVASGPGSYTGLRIGVATAKGICYALNIPLISLNTLSLLIYEFKDKFKDNVRTALLCPMLDARRMEVYCMLADNGGVMIEPIQAKVIDEQSFITQLDQQLIYFFGDGSDKCQNLIRHPNAKFVPSVKPSATSLGTHGFDKYSKADFEEMDFFEPLYLKDFLIKKPNSIF